MADIDRFELFTHVVQQGSLTQAAELLGCTKASISKQIKRLEQDFSINLFTRHKQRLLLTPEGEVLYEQCLRLRRELEDARSICQQLHAEPEGDLHVVVFEYFAKKLIFPRLKNFIERYPKLNLRIDTTERVPNFIEEQVDLAVGFSLPVPNPDEVIQKRMATTRYILCATPVYYKEFGIPRTLKELEEHKYISHTSRVTDLLIKLKPGYSCHISPYLCVNTVASMIACAKQHIGLIQLPLYMVDNFLKEKTLVECLSSYQADNASVFYHYPKRQYTQTKVKKFIEFFITRQ